MPDSPRQPKRTNRIIQFILTELNPELFRFRFIPTSPAPPSSVTPSAGLMTGFLRRYFSSTILIALMYSSAFCPAEGGVTSRVCPT